jgi:hypothetical protein
MYNIKKIWNDLTDFIKFKFNGGSNTWAFIQKKNYIKEVMDESYNKWKRRAVMRQSTRYSDFPESSMRTGLITLEDAKKAELNKKIEMQKRAKELGETLLKIREDKSMQQSNETTAV